jgi:hypothetical protein
MSTLAIRFVNTLTPKFSIDDSALQELRKEYAPLISKLVDDLNQTCKFIGFFNVMRWSLWAVALATIAAFALAAVYEIFLIFLGLALLTLWFVLLILSHAFFSWTVSRINDIYKRYLPKLTRQFVFSNHVNSDEKSKDPEYRMMTRFHNFNIGSTPFTLQSRKSNLNSDKFSAKTSQSRIVISSQPILVKTEVPGPARTKTFASFNKVVPISIPPRQSTRPLQPIEILAQRLEDRAEDNLEEEEDALDSNDSQAESQA